MNKLNNELPPVQYEQINHTAEDKEFFGEYFQRNFFWQYGSGQSFGDSSLAHKNYFISDYDTNFTPIKMLPIVGRIWVNIADKFEIDPLTKVGRCYLLGQTKDMDGPWHPDTDEDNVRTIVYYPCNNRRQHHQGTSFRFDDGEEETTPYWQDHAVSFDGRLMHRGLSTTSNDNMRVALVFQCIHLDLKTRFMLDETCGNDDRLDNIISKMVPR